MQTAFFLRLRHRCRGSACSQRGSLLIQFAFTLLTLALILGVVDLGYMFYAKRDLQRIADLAAIEAVQGIDFSRPGNATSCKAAGGQSIGQNWPAPLEQQSTEVICGEWNPQKYPDPNGRFFNASASTINAAHVRLSGNSPRFLPLLQTNRSIFAEAIAQRSLPNASFQIGSQLLNLEKNALLGRVLTLTGVDPDKLSVLDAQGLANAKITPSGLLKALGVNLGIDGLAALSPNEAARLSQLTLLNILNASADVISDSTLKAQIDTVVNVLAQVPALKLLDSNVPLLGDSSAGSSGLLTFLSLGKSSSPNAAALDTEIGLGRLLKTAIMLSANGHALQIPDLNVLNLVQSSLTVVEPPSIGIGPVGTIANSAQIRLNIDIDSRNVPLLGPVLDLLGVRIHLPIKVDGVSADATLEAIYCPDPTRGNQPSIDLGITSRIAKITMGDPMLASSHDDNLLIDGLGILKVRGPIVADVLEARRESINLIEGESMWTQANTLLLGNTVDVLTGQIFNLLAGLFSPPIIASQWSGAAVDSMSAAEIKQAQIKELAKTYLEKTKVNGFYNIDAATNLILNGSGSPDNADYMAKLVNSNFTFSNAIPISCLVTVCPVSSWQTGTFKDAFKAYATPGSVLDLLGISTLGNGYSNCGGLLSALLAWNACVLNNLENLLSKNSSHVNLTDGTTLLNSLKDSSSTVTCSGALCALLKPILNPIKNLLNTLGESVLSPLLNKVLGLETGRSEVLATDINCNTAQLVY